MMDAEMRIERAVNGFTLRMRDPKIAEKNHKDKGPWRDPNVTMVFENAANLVKFIEKNIETALPKQDTFATAFDTAVENDDG